MNDMLGLCLRGPVLRHRSIGLAFCVRIVVGTFQRVVVRLAVASDIPVPHGELCQSISGCKRGGNAAGRGL